MITRWDSEGVQSIIVKLEQAQESLRTAYQGCYKQDVDNFINGCRRYGFSTEALQTYRQRVTDSYRSIQSLINNLKTHRAEYDSMLASGDQNIRNQAMNVQKYGWLGPLVNAVYVGSAAWAFSSSGKSFSRDYNDIQAFMQSDDFKKAMQKAGVSKWSDTALILDTFMPWLGLNSTDDYIDGLLEGGLAGVLSGLPDRSAVTYDGSLGTLGAAMGVDNLDDWVSQMKNVLAAYGEHSKGWREFVNSDEYKEALAQITDDDLRREFGKALEEVLDDSPWGSKEAYYASEGAGAFLDTWEVADLCIDVALHCLNDYSTQIGYLNAMEEGMLQAGFGNERMYSMIDELRRQYSSDFEYAVDKAGDFLWKEAKKGLIGEGIKQLCNNYLPLVKSVNIGTGIVSGAAKVSWGDEISAYEGLAGLNQYDRCLTVAYENYERMMADGVATAQDIAQADALFELLRSTKIKEYEHMIALGSDFDQIEALQAKLDELKAYQPGGLTEQETGQFGGGGGGNRF